MGEASKKKKSPPGVSEATAAEMILRVDEVLRIRLDGAQFHDVVEYAREKGWNVGKSQIGNYIRKADNLLVERTDKRRKRRLAMHEARREALYGRSVNAADYRTALSVLADLAKLQGLYPAEKQEIEQRTRLVIDEEVVGGGSDDSQDSSTPPGPG